MRNPLALLAVAAVVFGLAGPAGAQSQPWSGSSIVKDPEWQKRFLGSYGFLSGAEPEINPSELVTLREVLEIIRANPRAAATVLEANTGPDSSAAFDFILANLKFQNGELDAAKKYYGTAIEKFPDFRRAHKNLGLLLVQESDFEGAVEHLSRAVELGDRDGRNFGLMGYSYINLGNDVAAESAYRNAILQDPKTKDWKIGLARALNSMEKHKEAAALFGSLIEDDPDDPSLWMLQANAYLGLDQPHQAAINLEAVRLMGKAQPSSLVLLGDIYMNSGSPELAKSAYLEVIESDEGATEFETAYRAAELLVRSRSYGPASEVLASIDERYGKGLSEDDELKVLTLKAKVARAQGREQEAAKLLESIVKRDGTRGDALLELAAYHDGQGNRPKALLLVERAENLEAFEYEALLFHARMEVSERNYDEAASLLRRAIQIRREPRVERFLERVEGASRGV